MRSLLLAVLVACSSTSPAPVSPPPVTPPPVVVADAAVPVAPAPPPHDYKVDPAFVGSGKTFMVVSESTQASAVGKQILANGGNAVDAAVAVALALAVTHPSAGNLSGGGFAVVHTGKGDRALDFRETAPAKASRDMYLDKDGKPIVEASLVGHRASGTPGSVAGLYALHKELGKLPWKDVVAPAIALAKDGFEVEPVVAEGVGRRKACLAKFPATAAIWLPKGEAPVAGSKMTIPDLAKVLQRIADKGADDFYKGETAKLIAKEMDGAVTAKDLAGYQAVWRTPLITKYRGYSFVTMPPPSSGGIVLAMTVNMMRGVDLAAMGWHSAAHVHRVVEVWRRAFAARNELLGDPAFVKDMPVEKLMSTEYADKLAATITDKATPSKEIPGLIEGNHTTNISVVDGQGNAIAMTTTLNTSYGSCVTVAGAGFLMNNEMDDFTVKPGSPNTFGLVQGPANEIQPGKRMLSSMSPTVVLDDKGVFAVAGAGGGPRIITAVWQVVSNLVDFKLAGDQAVAAPRFHHQHLPDKVFVEGDGVAKADLDALAQLGYDLVPVAEGREFASITAIIRTASGWLGSADRRGSGGAFGDN